MPRPAATGRSDVVAPLGLGVVGEDVVDLVAAPARAQPADVGALAVGLLESASGSAVGLEVLLVGFVLCEPEVDERAMPGVSEGHVRLGVSLADAVSLP